MQFHQVRYFLAVCDHLNFTRAAAACSVSQPALTVAVRKLEQELGGPLFVRDGRGVEITELGRSMRTHLARIEETRREVTRLAQAVLEDSAQEVNVGVFSTVGPGSVCGAMGAFQAANPDVRLALLDVWGPRTYDLLLSGAFDCAVVARPGPLPERIAATTLYEEPMVLAAAEGQPLARDGVRLADLDGAPYFDRLRCEWRAGVMAEMDRRGVVPDVRMRSEAEDWVLSAVAAGRGVTIMPRDAAARPGVRAVPIEDLALHRVIEIATVADRPLPDAARRFVDYMIAYPRAA